MTSMRRPLRVAHVITRMIVGGAQETVLLSAALSDPELVLPVVLCGPQTGAEGSLLPKARDRGVRVVVVPQLVRQPAPLQDLAVVPALARRLRAERIDIVHTHSSKAGIVGRLAARAARLPVVHTVHGWSFHDGQSTAVQRVAIALERATAPLAARLLVVAEADRLKGLRAGVGKPDQYRLIRSGLELSLYAPDPATRREVRAELALPQDALIVGSVNRLSPQKDPLTLLRAVAPLLRARSDARLLMVGDGPLRADVEAALATEQVRAQVLLLGLRDDVPRLLTAMDIFVSASRWEGLPRTILQATATGLPVVATAVDGVVDLLRHEHTGLLAAPGDARGLGDGLARLTDAPELGRTLAARAAQRLPEFDARTMADQTARLYEEVLSERGR